MKETLHTALRKKKTSEKQKIEKHDIYRYVDERKSEIEFLNIAKCWLAFGKI